MSDIIIFKVTGVLPVDIEVPGSEDFDWDYWVAYDTALEDIVVQGERRLDVVRELERLGRVKPAVPVYTPEPDDVGEHVHFDGMHVRFGRPR